LPPRIKVFQGKQGLSTTETAVAEDSKDVRSPNERATALGPGILRVADGAYLKPSEATVDVVCSGPLAYWTVKCTFPEIAEPGSETPLFLYPLPPEAAIQKLSIDGEAILPGRLEVRAVDDLPEEESVPTPPPSFLGEFGHETQPIFSLSLAESMESLAAGGLEIELEFASGLATVDGRISLFVPAQVSPELATSGETVLELTVALEDGDELVDAPTAPSDMESDQDGETLTLVGTFDNPCEPVVVTFRPGRTQMPVRRLRRGENHFIFSIYPPTSIPASPQRRDIVFALDASENIEAQQFTLIKEELCETLRTLDENDRFALVTFGRDIDGYDGGEFCDIEQVPAACEWLQGIEPKGRSDVQPLLQRIQSLPSQEERQLCIFLLAGGHVGNEPAILRSLDFDQSDRRYYTVGVGPRVEQAFLRRLALLTRGRCEVSSNGGGCYKAVERLLGQTRALLAEVTFEDQDDSDFDADQLVPSRMTSLTPLGPVHCLGSGSPSSIRFRSKDETGVFFAGTVNAEGTENPALGGVWAGLRVREMLDSVHLTTGAKKKSLKSEATRLAAEYGILTEDTVLVEETDDGLRLQFSAQPKVWHGSDSKEKKSNVSSKDGAAPFDWRKGLVAREGLFKGKPPSDSGESSGRYGLRAKTSNSETSSKPRLDRAVNLSSSSSGESGSSAPKEAAESPDVEATEVEVTEGEATEVVATDAVATAELETAKLEAPVEVSDDVVAENVTQDEADPGESAVEPDSGPDEETVALTQEEVASVQSDIEAPVANPEPTISGAEPVEVQAPVPQHAAPVPVPVPVGSAQSHVVHLATDPLAAGRVRMESYYSQLDAYDTELSLASIQGLPGDLSPHGGDLPRILAQTVAHLEKRGYFSHAVSVLGLLLRDNPSAEVYRKMESLLASWADSLPEDKLPEAIQILQLGNRACHGSELLTEKAVEAHARWASLSGAQAELPVLSRLNQQNADDKLDSLLSQPQIELAKIKAEQTALSEQVAELKRTLESVAQGSLQPVSATPEVVVERTPEVAVEPTPEPVTIPIPEDAVEPPTTVAIPMPEEAVEPTPEGAVEPTPEAVDIPMPEVVVEPTPEAVEIPMPEVVIEPTPEVAVEPAPEVAVEPAPEVVVEPTPEVAVEPTPEVAVEPTPEVVVEPTPEVAVEPTPEVVVEPTPEVAVEPTPEVVVEPTPEVVVEPTPEVAEEDSGEELALTKEELTEMLLADPRSEESREAVMVSMPEPKERVNFFREMVKADKSEPYHSLSLARSYRDAGQTKVAVVHFQKYLRAEKEPAAYLELASAYDELGKENLGASARRAAETYKGA
jgi:hypothetical protein